MSTETALPITEQENPRSKDLSSQSTAEIVALMNDEDTLVAAAVQRVLGDVVKAIDETVARLEKGGRLFYTGTGTSGRLGVLDASECPPTFGVSPELVQGVIAGGYDACHRAVEASEDDADAGAADLKQRGFGAGDVLVGIAASGRTPYTVGAVKFARSSQHFWSNNRNDTQLRRLGNRRTWYNRQPNCECSDRSRKLHCPDCIRRPTGGRDSDQHITRPKPSLL